jgi:hypothetical protein
VLFEALSQPDRDPARPWLTLLSDEQAPRILQSEHPSLVVWSSLWLKRPDARIRFDVLPDARGQGSDLRWTLLVEEPEPAAAVLGHLRTRVNQLINANLRFTFGQ